MGARGTKITTVTAWLGALLLVALHLWPRTDVPVSLVGGWLPGELAYRLLWMAAALVYLAWFCRVVWRDDEGDDGDAAPRTDAGDETLHPAGGDADDAAHGRARPASERHA